MWFTALLLKVLRTGAFCVAVKLKYISGLPSCNQSLKLTSIMSENFEVDFSTSALIIRDLVAMLSMEILGDLWYGVRLGMLLEFSI